jgi:hypothetical protein
MAGCEIHPVDPHRQSRQVATEHYGVDVVAYRDPLAFPLSGGTVTRQWLPHIPRIYPLVLAIDEGLNALLKVVHLQRTFAWRVLVRAVRI